MPNGVNGGKTTEAVGLGAQTRRNTIIGVMPFYLWFGVSSSRLSMTWLCVATARKEDKFDEQVRSEERDCVCVCERERGCERK